ncbi:MAG: hypothetical protein NT082_06025 [Chloroflexi bacterium]|nr:hypothetical protein [Chloroflexota bacterium]
MKHHGRLTISLLLLFSILFSNFGTSCSILKSKKSGQSDSSAASVPVVNPEVIKPYLFDNPSKTVTKKATKKDGLTIKEEGLTLVVPPGAVKSDTQVVVKTFNQPPPSTVLSESDTRPKNAVMIGKVYDFGPDGTEFDKPVQVTLPYDKSLIKSKDDANKIQLAYYNGENWVAVPSTVDTAKSTVSAQITGFPGLAMSTIYFGIAAAALVVAGGLLIYYESDKIRTNPLKSDTIKQYVQTGTLVDDNIKIAGVQEWKQHNGVNYQDGWIPLEDPAHKGKLNPKLVQAVDPTLVSQDMIQKIGFKKSVDVVYPKYKEHVKGEDLNWLEPDQWFTNGYKGDCTAIATSHLSMLRALGVDAWGVEGSLPSGKRHAWIEFCYEGRPYYYDAECGICPLDLAEKIMQPKRDDSQMFNEKGRHPYTQNWWNDDVYDVSLKIIAPVKIGLAGTPYTFTTETENIHKGAKFQWRFYSSKDEEGAHYKDRETAEHTYKTSGKKTIRAEYGYEDDLRTIAYDEIEFEVQSPVPVIKSFNTSAPSVIQGSCSTLTWEVTGADSVIINPGSTSVAAVGSCRACPASDTTYILTATNAGGTVTRSVSVKWVPYTPAPAPAPAPTPTPTPAPTPSADKEEVNFEVYREVTTTFSDKSVTKDKQYCQQFLVKIYKVEGFKETFLDPGVQGGFSIARNGLYTRILPVGRYKYIVNGDYTNPDGFASGIGGFDVVKGGSNWISVVDSATRSFK